MSYKILSPNDATPCAPGNTPPASLLTLTQQAQQLLLMRACSGWLKYAHCARRFLDFHYRASLAVREHRCHICTRTGLAVGHIRTGTPTQVRELVQLNGSIICVRGLEPPYMRHILAELERCLTRLPWAAAACVPGADRHVCLDTGAPLRESSRDVEHIGSWHSGYSGYSGWHVGRCCVEAKLRAQVRLRANRDVDGLGGLCVGHGA